MKKYAVLFEEFISDPAQEASLQRQFQTNNMGPVPVTHEVAEVISDENGMSVDVKGGGPIVDMTDPGADVDEDADRQGLTENTPQLKNKYSGLLREKKFSKEDLATLDSEGSYRGEEDSEVKKLGIIDKKDLIDHIRNQMNDEWIKKEIH
jgi:hypothetical protein